jgi:rubredoxin-NAD+ reductase
MVEPGFRRWVCDACGYIYDEAKGDPDSGLAAGTRYEDIPEDWQCPWCGLSKGDLRLLPEPVPASAASRRKKETGQTTGRPTATSRGGDDHVVIVGAGIAGWSVAGAIRARDPDTPLLLVTACEGVYYPKPALSTALAHGKQADDLAEQDAAAKAAELGIEVRTDTRVIKLDPARRRLTTAKGGIQYGRLVLALGARQRELPVDGDAADSVLRVNDLAAYRRLRNRLDAGARHVTILGAGLIGCEFADDLLGGGYGVTVVDPTDRPLSSLLPPATAAQLRQRLEDKGLDWRFGAMLDRLEHGGERLRATFSDGDAIETDVVLSAAGLRPNTTLAAKSGIETARGIRTDRTMRTSVDGVYAIGDCAEVEGRVFSYIEPIRRQAETIAAALRGEQRPFDIKPPLVRVKTPSFPLSICPVAEAEGQRQDDAAPGRLEFLNDDQVVGFVLSGERAGDGMSLYRQIYR